MFFSIQAPNSAKIKIKGSEFIAFICPIKTTSDFESFLKNTRKEHFKATHHCQAYRLDIDPLVEFHSDDGEPRGSAGLPILNALKSSELINVGAIVVRYYGGTKLGVRGLIDAYREATEIVLESSRVQELEDRTVYRLNFEYHLQSTINTILHSLNIHEMESTYAEQISLKLSINTQDSLFLEKVMSQNLHLGFTFKKINHMLLPKI